MGDTVAITVKTSVGLSAPLDPRFGRTPVFLVVTREANDWKVAHIIENRAADDAQGAGGAAATQLAKLGVTDVISGRYGPKAYQALNALHIRMWMADEDTTAEQAISSLGKKELKEMKVTVFR